MAESLGMNNLNILLIFLFLVGCGAAPYYPKTKEGALCKRQCAIDMAKCEGSSYTCDSAQSACYSSCRDIERLSK